MRALIAGRLGPPCPTCPRQTLRDSRGRGGERRRTGPALVSWPTRTPRSAKLDVATLTASVRIAADYLARVVDDHGHFV